MMSSQDKAAVMPSGDRQLILQPLTAKQRKDLLPQLVALAHHAGEAIMEIYRSGEAGTVSKADDSPLTLADLASHKTIVAGLKKLTPAIPVLSEEADNISYVERRKWTCFWLVDPLDGTKEFIKRNGEFTVNIALIENGIPVMGVVYAPVLEVSYYAAKATGAFVQHGENVAQAIKVKSHVPGKTIHVVASRSHSDARTEALLEQMGDHKTISMGSSLKLCLVAEGEAHCYPRLGPTMEWDTAAAHAIVSGAGGIVCDNVGEVLRYNKEDMHNPEFFVLSNEDKILRTLLKIPC